MTLRDVAALAVKFMIRTSGRTDHVKFAALPDVSIQKAGKYIIQLNIVARYADIKKIMFLEYFCMMISTAEVASSVMLAFYILSIKSLQIPVVLAVTAETVLAVTVGIPMAGAPVAITSVNIPVLVQT